MSADDVPEHLIEAYESSDDYSDEHPVERILAALRPEDAHRVPAWGEQWDETLDRLTGLVMERDMARAEVERLREQYEPVESAAAVSLPGTRGER